MDPRDDTKRKMTALGRLREGHTVLDICTGALSGSSDGALRNQTDLAVALEPTHPSLTSFSLSPGGLHLLQGWGTQPYPHPRPELP